MNHGKNYNSYLFLIQNNCFLSRIQTLFCVYMFVMFSIGTIIPELYAGFHSYFVCKHAWGTE